MEDFTVPNQTLKEWLDCGTSFCELVKTLDPEAVRGAAMWVDQLPAGLHLDAETYLRAAGVATERFSRTAETCVRGLETTPFNILTFSVEAGDPVMDSQVAILRIQRLRNKGRQQPHGVPFVPSGLRQRLSEPLLYGAEARIALFTPILHFEKMMPGVRFTYEVTGQHAIKVFASVLQHHTIQPLWEALGEFDVETSITLTKGDSQDSIEEKWATSDDPHRKRLLKFCRKASRMSAEETSDWPPYLRLTRLLDSTNTPWDFERCFTAICTQTTTIQGPSGGWSEILEPPEAQAISSYS